MSDLIWVGNTLYPRWIVFAIPLGFVIVLYLVAFCASRHEQEM